MPGKCKGKVERPLSGKIKITQFVKVTPWGLRAPMFVCHQKSPSFNPTQRQFNLVYIIWMS